MTHGSHSLPSVHEYLPNMSVVGRFMYVRESCCEEHAKFAELKGPCQLCQCSTANVKADSDLRMECSNPHFVKEVVVMLCV